MNYVVLILIAICVVIPVSGQIIPEATGSEFVPIISSPRGETPFSTSSGGRWQPLGEGLPGRVLGTAVLNDELYTVVEEPERDGSMRIHTLYRWDGSSWIALNRFQFNRQVAEDFAAYRGELYLAGGFTTIDSDSSFKGLARWDGTRWQPVRGGILDKFQDIVIHDLNEIDGRLYCAGSFRIDTETLLIIQFEGTTWSEVGYSPRATGWGHAGMATAMYKGDLYLGGSFSNADMRGFAKWDGNRWTGMPGGVDSIHCMEEHVDGLYCYGKIGGVGLLGIQRWDQTSWNMVGESKIPFGFNYVADMQSYNGDLYIAGIIPGQPAMLARWDGTLWHTVSTFDNDLYHLAIFNGRLAAAGAFRATMEHPDLPLNRVALFCGTGGCGSISGTVFDDADADCIEDDTEDGMRRHIIEVTPGPFYATTDAEGSYNLPVVPGTYTVSLIPRLHWEQICPTSSGVRTAIVPSGGDAVKDISFGVRPLANIRDLRVTMVAGPARPGRQLVYCITYENAGTVTMDGTVSLLLDPILTFDSSAPPPTRVRGSLIEWDFTALKPGEERTIKVWTTIPRTTERGTDICSDVRIDPAFNDFSIDDRDSVCVRVTGSYDPNDISVTPFGIEDNGEITPEDSVLTYTVRFQNTGNDTAFQVRVIDTLNSHLDIRSIRLGAASHEYAFNMSGSNVVTWTFDDIMLPDSGANEANSHGMFKYSVRLKRGLATGTSIPNRASIYFDYNAPVITNTVESIIGELLAVPDDRTSSEATAFYPNPARDAITITAEMVSGSVVEVRDLLGRTALRQTYDGGAMRIDITSLSAGTYFVRIATREGVIFQQVSVVR